MTNNRRILNVTRGFTLKHKQALRAIEQCACAWVIFGESIRDLTLAESIAARNHQAAERETLPEAEIPGVTFQPPQYATKEISEMYQLVQQANALVANS